MSVVITTYTLAGGFIEAGMNWWQAMITILLGNTIVLIPMILNAHAGTKYGVSFPVLCRAAFGTKGANVPAMLRAIVACGWFGIQTWIGGTAIDALFGIMFPALEAISTHDPRRRAAHLDCVLSVLGHSGLHHSERRRRNQASRNVVGAAAARRRLDAAGLGCVARRRPGPRADANQPHCKNNTNDFWPIFPGALTASVGYWATLSLNIPDFTRYARSQRSQMLGQALDLPLTMTAFAFIGVAVTSATLLIYGVAIPNPVDLMARFDSVLDHSVRDGRDLRGAAHDEHGRERRLAVERFFESESAD